MARGLPQQEAGALAAGLSVAEVMLPKTRPTNIGQLGLR